MHGLLERGQFAPPVDANELFESHAVPFNWTRVKQTPDRAVVGVQFRTETGEPLCATGEAVKTNGESPEELLFSAASQAVSADVFYLSQQEHSKGVELRFFDREATVWSAQGETFEDAVNVGLVAYHNNK